jgi:hypothetical protein
MTTIRLPSGMTLPAGTRHAGLDRLSAGAALVGQLLDSTVRTIDARRARAAATRRGIEAGLAGRPQRYDAWQAGLPRGLGD